MSKQIQNSNKKAKYVAIGALIGVLVGTTAFFLLPKIMLNLANFPLLYNQKYWPDVYINYYSVKGGSFYNILPIVQITFGLVGAIIGFIFQKRDFKSNEKIC